MSSLNPAPPEAPAFAAWIGLDWADRKHFWSLRTAEGQRQRGQLENTPEAVEAWAAELAQRFGGRPIALALEQARGAVIAMLSKYAPLVLFPVHPATLANYRKSFAPSGAKSDAHDGDLILDLLLKHPERLQPWQPDTVETRSLQFLCEERRKLVNQRSSEAQRLTHWLKMVYPQILRWFDDPATPLVGDLLLRWPTLERLQKASPKTLLKFFQRHNCRSEERNRQRLAEIRQAVAATHDAALLETGVLCLQNSVRLLAQMRAGIEALESRIEEIYRTHPDRAIVASFPGAGAALEPRLIAAVGSQRERFAAAHNLSCFSGIAPVTANSGNARWVHWRWACPKFIRQTFHEWANCSIRSGEWAREFYEKKRAEGKGHHAAVRALAYKWIRIFFRCWRDGVPYDEQRYLEARRKHAPKPQPGPTAPEQRFEWKNCGNFYKLVEVSA